MRCGGGRAGFAGMERFFARLKNDNLENRGSGLCYANNDNTSQGDGSRTLVARGNKKSSDELVVGGHHLLGLFGLLVVMLGIAFTLGYLLGRNQDDVQVRAPAGLGSLEIPASRSRETNDPPPKIKPLSSRGVSAAGAASAASSTSSQTRATSRRNPLGNSPDVPDSPPDWDFYHSGEPAKPVDRLTETSTPVPPPAKPAEPVRLPGGLRPDAGAQPRAAMHSVPVPARSPTHLASLPPSVGGAKMAQPAGTPSAVSKLIPHGATVLQVAAVVRQSDARTLAQALQKKKFPVFVVTPDTDRFYRVQIGPYRDKQSVNAARQKLEQLGFKSIVKR
jgi:cell division septation protein DedD